MIIFILNMVSVSMVMMAAFVLIILRDRTDTQILLSGVCLEAVVALGSLMWIRPDELDLHFLSIRIVGRTIEAIVMWSVIVTQVRGIQRERVEPTVVERFGKKLEELETKVTEIHKPEGDNGVTH